MIDGYSVVAFTPVGRKRYMDILAGYMAREQRHGRVDKWFLFNNAYLPEDSTYADQLAERFGWIEVIREHGIVHEMQPVDRFQWSRPENISLFYKYMEPTLAKVGYDADKTVYLRFDDDICYLDVGCIEKWVCYRIEHPEPFAVFPTIINNVRTSYHMQQQGIVPECGIKNDMYDQVAWRNLRYVHDLHMSALDAIDRGTLVRDFALKSECFPAGEGGWTAGHISINAFAVFAKDLHACNVAHDEEGYLSLYRPQALGRPNARCGDAVLIHFAYHTQTEYMDKTGLLNDYALLAPPLGFRTKPLTPSAEYADVYSNKRRLLIGELVPPHPRFTIRNVDGSIKEQRTIVHDRNEQGAFKTETRTVQQGA
jgi:hypothetical protein